MNTKTADWQQTYENETLWQHTGNSLINTIVLKRIIYLHYFALTKKAFYTVPAIETSKGFRLVQSQAIMHYVGRATGMDCDCDDMHHCEVIALGVW